MAYDKVIDSTKLEAGMTATANAIRAKTGSTSPIAWDDETGFKTAVEVISSGDGAELPELGDTAAQPTDMAAGKVLYDSNGNAIEGTVPVVTDDARYMAWDIWDSNSSEVDEPYVSEYPNCVQIRTNILDELLIRQYSGMYTYIPKDVFGDASPSDVRKGKIFTSEFGVKAVGRMEESSGGYAIKSGTTTSGTIDTGLSNVEQFFIYKETVTGTGLIHLHYTKSATSRLYASAWSTNSWGTKTITNGTGGVTVSGGTVTISATEAAQGALTSSVTYKWTAIGTE